MQGRKAQSSLDSLLDQEQSVSWNTSNSSTFSLSNRAKSNSLPKSAFGSLQLKGTHYFGVLLLFYIVHVPSSVYLHVLPFFQLEKKKFWGNLVKMEKKNGFCFLSFFLKK